MTRDKHPQRERSYSFILATQQQNVANACFLRGKCTAHGRKATSLMLSKFNAFGGQATEIWKCLREMWRTRETV